MSNNTTNIDDLPENVQMVSDENNVKMDFSLASIEENRNKELLDLNNNTQNQTQNQTQTQNQRATVNNQEIMNKVVTDIQNVSQNGPLQLPSKHISQDQIHLTQDVESIPNFVPSNTNDYITQHETTQSVINKHINNNNNNTSNLDYIYNELQIPILIGVLYFTFQLPIVRTNVYKFLPMLLNKEGNSTGMGYIINSILFALTYYGISKCVNYLSI